MTAQVFHRLCGATITALLLCSMTPWPARAESQSAAPLQRELESTPALENKAIDTRAPRSAPADDMSPAEREEARSGALTGIYVFGAVAFLASAYLVWSSVQRRRRSPPRSTIKKRPR